MSTKCWNIDHGPGVVSPAVLGLEIASKVASVDLESDVVLYVAGVPRVADCDGDFGGVDVVCVD